MHKNKNILQELKKTVIIIEREVKKVKLIYIDHCRLSLILFFSDNAFYEYPVEEIYSQMKDERYLPSAILSSSNRNRLYRLLRNTLFQLLTR